MRSAPWLISLFAACAQPLPDDVDGESDETDTDAVPAARWPDCDPSATSQTLSFVHVNDMHGGFNPLRDVPGESPLSRAVGFYKATLRDNPFTVWTDGGDDFEKGSVVEDASNGEATTVFVRAMGFDARALGNHDFAYGAESVLAHTEDPRAVVLASNTTYIGDHPEGWRAVDRWVVDVGCVRIGFFSLNTRPYDGADRPYDGPYLEGVTTEDYDTLTLARAYVDELRDEVDLLVTLNHLGNGGESLIAENVSGIDLMLASHSHDATFTPVMVGETRIVQAGSGSQFILRMDVDVDLSTRKPTDWRLAMQLNAPGVGLPVDDAMEQVVEEQFTTWLDGGLWAPVGETRKSLSARGAGEMIARAAVHTTGADGALFTADYFKGGLPGGDITLQDLFDLANLEREPPGTSSWNSMHTVKVSGSDLTATLAALRANEFWVGPETIDTERTYTIVAQKKNAYYPDLFLAGMPVFTDVTYVGEIWKVGRAWAEHRKSLCSYLDVDETIPDCVP